MSDLRKKAKRAQLRLWVNRWFSQLGWVLVAAAALFVLAVLVDRLYLVRPEAEVLVGWMILGLAGASFLASIIWTAVTRESLPVAAAALDDAAGLKERISSAIYCEKMDDPFGQAVVADAHRVTHGLTVGRHLPFRFPQSGGYAGVTMVIALLVFWLFPVVDLAGKQHELLKEHEQQKQVEGTRAKLQPVIENQVEAFRKKYPGLEKEIEKLTALKGAPPTTRPEDVRNAPLKEISKVAQKIENKKDDPDLAKIEEFRNMAEKIAAQQRGDNAVSKLAQAMAKADYKSAQDALEEIKLELMKAPKTEADKQKADEMRKQVNDMASKLKAAAENEKKMHNELAKTGMKPEEIKRALEHLKKQDVDALKEQLKKKGLSEKDIEKLANQLKKCQGGCQMASKMAQNLQKAAQGQQGQQGSDQMSDSSEAGFNDAADQLSEMEAMQQQMNELAAAAADLKRMQDKVAGAGDGDGEGEGEGGGEGDGNGGSDKGSLTQSDGGMGDLGQGRGGVAPKSETGGKTTAQKAKVESLPGAIISTQFVKGEQITDKVSDEFVEAVISRQREVADAVNREAIPRQYSKPLSKYFNHATDGLPADKVKAAENKIESETKAEEAK